MLDVLQSDALLAQSSQSSQRVAGCPVCGAHGVRDFLMRADGRRLMRCSHCHAGVVNPMPSEAELSAIYSAGYFLGADDFFAGRSYYEARDEGLRQGQATGIEDLLRFGNLKGVSHLDIGCASGALLVLSRDLGARATGIEFSADACAEGRARYGLTIHEGTIENAPIAPGSQDLITAIDLIEHVPDPDSFMRQVAVALRSGGTLIVSTPNFRCATVLRHRWLGLEENMEHVVYFTPRSLRLLGVRHGMKITNVYTKGHPMLRRKGTPAASGPEGVSPPAQIRRGQFDRNLRSAARRSIDVLSGMADLGHDLVVWMAKS